MWKDSQETAVINETANNELKKRSSLLENKQPQFDFRRAGHGAEKKRTGGRGQGGEWGMEGGGVLGREGQ